MMNTLILTGYGYHDYVAAAAAALKIHGGKVDVRLITATKTEDVYRFYFSYCHPNG